MKAFPLLSVIVPCYNVADYLDECVESIISQKYENLEIILINDGSTDSTPVKCDDWSKKDKRIKVIHQKNTGLPIVREKGIILSKGEYITFVDSDDWIESEMYSVMMPALLQENADIVQCGWCKNYDDGRCEHPITDAKTSNYSLYDRVQSMTLLLEDAEWRSFFWNKIYVKSLFEGIVFPKGRGLDEDHSVMHQLFHKIAKSLYFRDEYYHYRMRSSSICHTADLPGLMKNTFDRCSARIERYLFIIPHTEYSASFIHLKNVTISVLMLGIRQMIRYPKFVSADVVNKFISQVKNIQLSYFQVEKRQVSRLKYVEYLLLRHCAPLYKLMIRLLAKAKA